MNIIEGNKLIAEFMGYKYFPFVSELKNKNGFNRWGWRKGKLHLPSGNMKYIIGKTHYLGRHHKDLKFHDDWNWLMGVVNNIKGQILNEEFNVIEKSLLSGDIQKVWKSVVIYIEKLIKKVSEFKKSIIEPDSISVILTGFKRDNFDLQIQSIQNQTIKPKNIFLYQDEEHVDLNKYREKYDIKLIQSKDFNFGFYGRMSMSLLMNTEYTLVIDDDTIPGNRWLENCLNLSKEKNCICGPGGRIVNDKTINEIFDHTDSPDAPFEEPLKVDFLIHSWFFKTEWVKYMFLTNPYTLYNGEDMHLSISCKVHGNIDTWVPKQPSNDKTLWGDTNIHLGTDEHATWRKDGHGPIRGQIMKYWMDEHNWKPINYDKNS